MSFLLLAAIEEAETTTRLTPVSVAVLVMSVFVFLLLVTFSFRSVHTRHPEHTAHGHHH